MDSCIYTQSWNKVPPMKQMDSHVHWVSLLSHKTSWHLGTKWTAVSLLSHKTSWHLGTKWDSCIYTQSKHKVSPRNQMDTHVYWVSLLSNKTSWHLGTLYTQMRPSETQGPNVQLYVSFIQESNGNQINNHTVYSQGQKSTVTPWNKMKSHKLYLGCII